MNEALLIYLKETKTISKKGSKENVSHLLCVKKTKTTLHLDMF
jgi:hypothetical protein